MFPYQNTKVCTNIIGQKPTVGTFIWNCTDRTTCHSRENKNLHLSPSALSLSVPASAYCLVHMCTLGSCCAAECIALSTGDVWEWFVGRWKRKTQMSPARIKCGNKPGFGGTSWPRVWLQEIRTGKLIMECSGHLLQTQGECYENIPLRGNNRKTQNTVPIFVALKCP